MITPDDDVADAILEAIDHSDGVDVDDGDVVLVSEKALSISQGNALPGRRHPHDAVRRGCSRAS